MHRNISERLFTTELLRYCNYYPQKAVTAS